MFFDYVLLLNLFLFNPYSLLFLCRTLFTNIECFCFCFLFLVLLLLVLGYLIVLVLVLAPPSGSGSCSSFDAGLCSLLSLDSSFGLDFLLDLFLYLV